ncbi:DNA topoisomerase III [Dongshaea marina]|uniref:DNA topoisomerase III n=1 Tax=Dongshaea marina TaxID=2047966 RepID=UPI000D3E8391|nr:DNA topoisomerase III [Dongshaea marina]
MRLFIAEKPTLGKAIAEALEIKKRHKGYIECANGDTVTWCVGHLLEQAEPEDYDEAYKTWSLEDLPIVPTTWKMLPKPETAEQLALVTELIQKADSLVHAGDPDREGELLINEVIEYAGVDAEKVVAAERLLINDMNPKAIERALTEMVPNREHLPGSHAAQCRSRADWLQGMNLSRAFTVLAKTQGHLETFSIGRVQTPTLQLVVKRDLDIKNFKPVTYFNVDGHFSHGNIEFKGRWQVPESVSSEQRCFEEEKARSMVEDCAEQEAVVKTCQTKREKSKPPLPFTMRTLQEEMSAKQGFSAKQTLELAQALYETHKLTSYPRTDTPYLSSDQKAEAELILANLEGLNGEALSELATQADLSLKSACWNDKKLKEAAHTAIIPTLRAPDLSALTPDEKVVYLAIASRYLAQFFPVAEDDQTTIELLVGCHEFKTTGKVEVAAGWRAVLGKSKEKGEAQELPVLGEGETIPCVGVSYKQKKTSPPKPFTEGTLLTAMCSIAKEVTNPAYKSILKETAGLGTEATRADIIEKLKTKGYLETSGKTLRSTDVGKKLILGLPDAVRDPALTAIWEQQLDVIEKGEYSPEKFMEKVVGTLSDMIADLKSGKQTFALPKSTLPRCKCGGWIAPYTNKKGKPAHSCTTCEKRFKDNKGKVGREIVKLGKLEV